MAESAPDPTRVVADVDVLAADLFIDSDARRALDLVRSHSWLTLILSDTLLTAATDIIATLSDASLAADWRATVIELGDHVESPPNGHPALAAATAGNAATILSHDARLQAVTTGMRIRPHAATSVKSPAAFTHLVNPEALYAVVSDEPYSGPDRDPRD